MVAVYGWELARFENNSVMISNFLNGGLDVTAQSALTMFPVEAENSGYYKFIYGQYNLSYSFVVADNSNINNLSDLKGKKIGTWTSPTAEACIKIRLAHLNESEYEIMPYGASMVASQLQNKNVDAVFLFDVFAEKLVKAGGFKYLEKSSMKDSIKNPKGVRLFNGGAFINTRLIEKNPHKALAIRDSLLEAVAMINSEPEKVKGILAKKLNVSRETALDAIYDEFHVPNAKTIESAKATIELLKTSGLFDKDKEIAVEKLFWLQ